MVRQRPAARISTSSPTIEAKTHQLLIVLVLGAAAARGRLPRKNDWTNSSAPSFVSATSCRILKSGSTMTEATFSTCEDELNDELRIERRGSGEEGRSFGARVAELG